MTTKRQLSALFLTLLSLVTAQAEVISQDAARQKAMNFLSNRLQTGKKAGVRGIQKLQVAESCETYYIFNIGDADGYVVVSGDDGMPDILGYSDNGRFETNDIPNNMRAWLKVYEKQYEYLKLHPEAKLTSRGTDSRKPIAPMLDCQWDQWSPFNDQCPNNCPTGCVATAMAQIMYYYKWPKQTTKTIPSYTSRTYGFFIPSIEVTNIDWDNMLPTYDSSSSEESRKAVSTLMKLCGAAENMDYAYSRSGSYMDGSVFAEYFDYDNGIELIKSNYSWDKWNNIIYEEIKNQRPVFYSGEPEVICYGDRHAFVVDGYDSNDYFHLNFGWGGRGDGFYLFTAISPENDDYSYQSAVVRIQPTASTNPKPYMTLDNGTLTFRYDSDRDKSKIETYAFPFSLKDRNEIRSQITHVIIDPSFADNILYTLKDFFRGFSNLETIEGLEFLNIINVTDMFGMFDGCSGLTSLDVSKLNTSNITDMSYMFDGCSDLTSLDLSNFNTSNVTSMSGMFDGCSGLTSLDLSNFNTSNVTSMSGMFWGCSGLTSLDLSNFNTSNVTYMYDMFHGCSGLTSIDLSNFNTSNVTNMSGMFRGCSSLTSIDLSNFNTSNVTDMSYMFFHDGYSELKTIFAKNDWNTDKVTNSTGMFRDCYNLIGGKGTKYNYSNTDHTYARIDRGNSAPGYFSLKGDCNGDGTVDKTDIVTIEDYIMGKSLVIFYEFAADMNNDGVINIADIVEIINNIKFK